MEVLFSHEDEQFFKRFAAITKSASDYLMCPRLYSIESICSCIMHHKKTNIICIYILHWTRKFKNYVFKILLILCSHYLFLYVCIVTYFMKTYIECKYSKKLCKLKMRPSVLILYDLQNKQNKIKMRMLLITYIINNVREIYNLIFICNNIKIFIITLFIWKIIIAWSKIINFYCYGKCSREKDNNIYT
jgi:hypothetical protein